MKKAIVFGAIMMALTITSSVQSAEPVHTLRADINHDGIVDILDFGILSGEWRKTESWYQWNPPTSTPATSTATPLQIPTPTVTITPTKTTALAGGK